MGKGPVWWWIVRFELDILGMLGSVSKVVLIMRYLVDDCMRKLFSELCNIHLMIAVGVGDI